MPYFSLRERCSFCNKDIGLYTGASRVELVDGWICQECMDILGDDYTVFELQKMSVAHVKQKMEEIAELDKFYSNHEVFSSQEHDNPLMTYNVAYLGGFPTHRKSKKHITLSLYKHRLYIEAEYYENFKPICINYKDIYTIKIVKGIPSSFFSTSRRGDPRYMYQENNIHISASINGNDIIVRLEMEEGSSVPNQAKECLRLLDYIRISEIDEQFRKKEQEQNSTSISVADEILKFKQLLDMGAISQEKYEEKKKELLNL